MVNTEKYSKYIENNYKQEFLEKKNLLGAIPKFEGMRQIFCRLYTLHFHARMHWILGALTFVLPCLLPAPINPLFSPQV